MYVNAAPVDREVEVIRIDKAANSCSEVQILKVVPGVVKQESSNDEIQILGIERPSVPSVSKVVGKDASSIDKSPEMQCCLQSDGT